MKRKILFTLTISLFISQLINAQDRQFVRTYQSANMSKGARDLELWTTLRAGKESFYRGLDERLEFEVGLTDRLQTSIYLNATHQSFVDKSDSTGTIQSQSDFSISSEWKFKMSDANINFLGSAVYAEATVSGTGLELEGKLILDKRIGNHLIALNALGEWEWEQEITSKEVNNKVEQTSKSKLMATPFELDLGYMYNFKPHIGLGVEARNQYEITTANGLEHSALLLGPTLYWSPKEGNYNIILSFMPQITNLRKSAEEPNALDLDEYEKYDFRILLDFSF